LTPPLRVLGIDPGSQVAGWGLVRRQGSVLTFEAGGALRPKRGLTFAQRLECLHRELSVLIDEHRPDAFAIEAVFHAQHARSALQLGHARGVLVLAAAQRDLAVHEYPPATVKKAVTGSGSADKEAVRKMVCLLLKAEIKGPLDTTDALAVAICHAQAGRLAGAGVGKARWDDLERRAERPLGRLKRRRG